MSCVFVCQIISGTAAHNLRHAMSPSESFSYLWGGDLKKGLSLHRALRRMQQLDKLERLPNSQHCPKTKTHVFSSSMKVHIHVLWFPTRFSFYQIPEQKLFGINASVLKSWKLLPRIHSCDFYLSSLLKEDEEQGTDIYWTPTGVKFFLWIRTLTALRGRWGTKTETGPMWLVPCH